MDEIWTVGTPVMPPWAVQAVTPFLKLDGSVGHAVWTVKGEAEIHRGDVLIKRNGSVFLRRVSK